MYSLRIRLDLQGMIFVPFNSFYPFGIGNGDIDIILKTLICAVTWRQNGDCHEKNTEIIVKLQKFYDKGKRYEKIVGM